MDYEKQAEDFAKKAGVTLTIVSSKYGPYFEGDKQSRHIFKCRLKTPKGQYTFEFGQSINNGDKKPSMYSIFTCLEKYGYADFNDFCANMGYDTDSRKAERIYKAVVKEHEAVERLFTPEQIEELKEIQ